MSRLVKSVAALNINSVITDFVVSASMSTVTLSAASIFEGDSLIVTITARNAAGQRLVNKAITSVTVTPNTGITVSGAGNTNVSGVATRNIQGDDAGVGFVVSVVCDGVALDMEPSFDVEAVTPGSLMFIENFFRSDMFVPGFWVGT